MQQLGLWETVDHIRLMRPMLVRVQLRGGATGPGYAAWRKRLVLMISLLGMTYRAEGEQLVVHARDGGQAGLKQRARLLDWLMAQPDVEEVECARPPSGATHFAVCAVEARR